MVVARKGPAGDDVLTAYVVCVKPVTEDTVGRRCLCNGLLATIGLGQRRPDGYAEPPLVTLGQDLSFLAELTRSGPDYTAADVVAHLLAPVGAPS